jgi:maltose O-acetyltransferase
MIRRIVHCLLQLKGWWVFGRRVGVLGNFTVVNPANVSIGANCGINHGVFILGAHRVVIGSGVVLSARCMLLDAGLDSKKFSTHDFPPHLCGPIEVGDGAWIGAAAVVLPGVKIGKKAIVGAGSIVTRDVPEGVIVAGNPARPIGSIHETAS